MAETDRILAQLEPKAQEITDKILDKIDSSWEAEKYPDRLTILNHFPEFKNSENALIFFLKKHGSKHIASFQIKNQNSKHPWPTLITKRFIRKKGQDLHKKAADQVNKQQVAAMPNQYLYDLNLSLERFLSKILK